MSQYRRVITKCQNFGGYELFSCFILFLQIPCLACHNMTTDHLMRSRIEFPRLLLLLSTHYNNY